MSFVHLHSHTEFSLLDASNKVVDYVARVKELGMNSAAITDHGVMYGVIRFYRECIKQGINPILGCEVYVAPESRFSKEKGESEDRYYHLVLLAENNTGYQNLIKMVSLGFTEGLYYKPRIDMELLEKYHEGIIGLSACLQGEIPKAIIRGMREDADAAALRMKNILGEGNFFLELQDHGISEQTTVNMALIDMSKRLNIPLVVTNDVHYTYAEDVDAHDILLCLQTGKKLRDENRMRYPGGQFYVKSEEEMRAVFPYAQEAIENTQKIADRCHVEITFGEYKLPHFDVPAGYDSRSYLSMLCSEGLKKRYTQITAELTERLDYELGVIEKMGFTDYFLIVWDYINYCRENGIPVGPGRGSAAGSLVAYTLRITDIDPIRYDLLFERFLNPGRITMPDIDVDFSDDRREDVIRYVSGKYGESHVVQIGTFNSMLARGVIRDVARVMEIPYSDASNIAKMVPSELGITLDKAIEVSPDLKALYNSDAEVHHLLDMCRKLEGLPRNSSTHAAAVVICPDDADKYLPLFTRGDGPVNTQFDKDTVEELGLLKMDFLGLRTLSVIRDAVDMAEKNHNIKIDIENIDYDDPKVMELIGSGHTEGVFQLESAGMKSFMKELAPHTLEDIIAGISLYRPGPMDFIPKYIQGKNDPEHVTYECPELEPILSATYGCIVYQEQVMQIVRTLAGYSMAESDNIRKAMSKKKQEVIDQNREVFINGNAEKHIPGAVAEGIDKNAASRIYDSMVDFAKYAFNKSHAACYAVVAMRTAYLKRYYPVEFMAALMTSVVGNTNKVAQYIINCKEMGIGILPPDINEGDVGFTAEGDNIRFTLCAVKSVGYPIIRRIIDERHARGPYRDIRDFLTRVGDSGGEINKRVVENLIKAGAMDSLGARRRQLMMVYEKVMEEVHRSRKTTTTGQLSFMDLGMIKDSDPGAGSLKVKLPPVEEYPKEELLKYEREVLGIFLSGHPIEEYEDLWKSRITNPTTDFKLIENDVEDAESGTVIENRNLFGGENVCVGGIITAVTVKYTKKNDIMAFVTLEDMVGSVEVIVFPKCYEKYRSRLEEDALVFIYGHSSEDDDRDMKVIADRVLSFNEVPGHLWIQFDDEAGFNDNIKEIAAIAGEYEGSNRIYIYIRQKNEILKDTFEKGISLDREAVNRLQEKFGRDNVKVTYAS